MRTWTSEIFILPTRVEGHQRESSIYAIADKSKPKVLKMINKSHLVDHSWLKVDKDGSGHVLAGSSLISFGEF